MRDKGHAGRIDLTNEQALYLRMRGQGLLPQYAEAKGGDVTAQVARLTGGLQAQDLFAATLGVRVRAAGSTLADFERSRLERRTVVWTWLMRGTLHLVPTEDLGWLLTVFGPPTIAATSRRRHELGLDAEVYSRGLDVVLDRLTASGPSTREELGQALADAGLPHGYSIERHLMFLAAFEGHVCFGPDRGAAPGANPTFALLSDWLPGTLERVSSDDLAAAKVRLTRRYLDAFAPASLADYSSWAGLNVRDLREAWDSVRADLVEVSVAGQTAFVPEARMAELDEPMPSPVIRLLPAFDAYILGHRTRELIDDGRYAAVYKGGGMLPATVLVDGQLQGDLAIESKRPPSRNYRDAFRALFGAGRSRGGKRDRRYPAFHRKRRLKGARVGYDHPCDGRHETADAPPAAVRGSAAGQEAANSFLSARIPARCSFCYNA